MSLCLCMYFMYAFYACILCIQKYTTKRKYKCWMPNWRIQSHFWVSPRSPKCNFWEPLQAKRDWKEQIRNLSSVLNNFGPLKNPTKGGGALKRPAPLCRFFSLPKFFEHLLKVSYFFLSIHFGLQGLPKITFWGPWTYSKINLIFTHICWLFLVMFDKI